MNKVVVILARALIGLAWMTTEIHMFAGGSGLNTVVVVNQNSSNSLELANYYLEQRSIPAENLLRINWPGDNISWFHADFTNLLLNPLLEMLNARGPTNQIEYVALSMDIPFQTLRNSADWNGTTSALFYGLKVNNPGLPANLNTYAGSEIAFTIHRASDSAPTFLVTMLTAGSTSAAKQMIDQGTRAGGALPSDPVLLAKSSDPNRNFRSGLFDNAIFNSRIRGTLSIDRINSDDPSGMSGLLGYQTGLARFEVSSNTFVSGAISDSVTSYGGRIFGPNDQTNLLEFIHAGAAGSYGTVAEPLADPDKFPNPMVYFYQARGFTLAESYYQSLRKPYLGLIVGEPLSAPFAARGRVSWSMIASNAPINGSKLLGLSFQAHSLSRPIQQVDFFIDGRFSTTLTNLSPREGNVLSLWLNGYPITYTVPANATLNSVASNLVSLINNPVVTNAVSVQATAFGDRIELQASHTSIAPCPFYVVDSGLPVGAQYRARYLSRDFPLVLKPVGMDSTGAFQMILQIPTPQYCVVEASTNLSHWLPVFTNTAAGFVEFRDAQSSAAFSQRFYRIAGSATPQTPKISIGSETNSSVRVRVESEPGQPCALLVSTNAAHWTGLITNHSGGVFQWSESQVGAPSRRFFRAWLVPPPEPIVSVSNLPPISNLIRVDHAAQPFIVERSTNGVNWTSLTTNFAFHDIQVTATSAVGSANLLTTWLNADRPILQSSPAYGLQSYTFLAATVTSGAWAQFVFTTTNGGTIAVSATNLTPGVSVTNLAWQLYNRINAEGGLQGVDGVVAEDFYINAGGQARFNLRARSRGEPAAQLGVQANVSGFTTGVSVSPATYRKLNKNLDDLRCRNHLYITAGLAELDLNFPLNTQTLPDGFHDLTAIGYEGSSVRVQTPTTIPVEVQNTSLTASLNVMGTNILSVASNFNITVTANTNAVREILLYSTGGLLAGATNVGQAVFPVNGQFLGPGKHPFYALVTTTNNLRYRTEPRYVTLTRP